MKYFVRKAALVIATAMASAAAQGQGVSYSGSLQFASGDYIFAERTSSFYFTNGLSWSSSRWSTGLTWPIIVQNTAWISYGGAGVIPSGGPLGQHVGSQRRRQHTTIALPDTVDAPAAGFGDPTVFITADLVREGQALPGIRLAANVKAPLADVDRGFGTGEWDYGFGLSLSKSIGRSFLFADAAFWRLGDMNGLELNDPIAYGFGLGRSFGDYGLLASFAGYTTIIDGTDPPVVLMGGVTRYFAVGRSLSLAASAGLTESAPDVSISLGWGIGL